MRLSRPGESGDHDDLVLAVALACWTAIYVDLTEEEPEPAARSRPKDI
jgi:hypothetical protein